MDSVTNFVPNTPDEIIMIMKAHQKKMPLEVNVYDGRAWSGWWPVGESGPDFNFGWCRYRIKFTPAKFYGYRRPDGGAQYFGADEASWVKAQTTKDYKDYIFFTMTEDTPADLSDPLSF